VKQVPLIAGLSSVGIVCLCSALLLSQQKPAESGPGSPEAQKAGRAALAFARSVAEAGTPEFTEALRNASALAGGHPIEGTANRARSQPVHVRGLLDLDPRYRQNFESMDPQQRIFGGERVPPGLYPDTVAITGNGRICTGTLVTNTAVLTAAHCVCRGVTETVFVGDSLGSATAQITVANGTPMIDCTAPLQTGDVGVLFLNQPAPVQPRKFAHDSLIDAAAVARAVGFGRTENPIAEPIGIKRRVDVPVTSIACKGTVKTTDGVFTDTTYYGCSAGQELVAGAPSLDKDSCNGDSGGPLFVTAADGNLYLAGATSRATGPPGLRPCGDGGIYVRTDARVRKWLQTLGVTVAVGPVQ
jgi:hypothetical protein